ncbi:uncharacterized protein LOC143027786 isoform X2 [Oratosquilla oratoria]|uniref:uncharacterized protein LOC143027786 isoform X2 n=1 Tax=Oratosquilla oratoria TaxID=337810 RepID=UPI003F759F9D
MSSRLLLLMPLLVMFAALPASGQGVLGSRRSGPRGNGIRKTARAILWCLEGSFTIPELVRFQFSVGPALTSCLNENGVALRPDLGPPSSVSPEVPVNPGIFGPPPTVATTETTVVTSRPVVPSLPGTLPGGSLPGTVGTSRPVVPSLPGTLPGGSLPGRPASPDNAENFPGFGTAEGVIPDPFGGQPPAITESPVKPQGSSGFGTAMGVIPDPFGGKPPVLAEDGTLVIADDLDFPSPEVAEGYRHLASLIAFPSPGVEKPGLSTTSGMSGFLRTGNSDGRVRTVTTSLSERVLSCIANRMGNNDIGTQTKIVSSLNSCPSAKAKNRLIKLLRRISVADSTFINAVERLRDNGSITTLNCFARTDLGTLSFVIPELTRCLEAGSTPSLGTVMRSTVTVNCFNNVMASAYMFTVGSIPPSIARCGSLGFSRRSG